MKSLSKIYILVFMIAVSNANPIMEFFLNELLLDADDPYNWQLEIRNSGHNFENWFLTTQTDTAYFKDSINWEKEFIVITPDSLTQPLSINPHGDIIRLHESSYGSSIDQIKFGSVNNSDISVPLAGQSISLEDYVDWDQQQQYFYYLDNTPTIGLENDMAEGTVEGYIKNLHNQPIPDYEVHYDFDSFFGQIYTLSDSNGFFSFNENSKKTEIEFKKMSYDKKDTVLQIWPDSLLSLFIRVVDTVTSIDPQKQRIVESFFLEANYPNPFNNRTIIEYSLPLSDFVELSIFDVTGKKIETLVSGYFKTGNHLVKWEADNYSSGVYVYRLTTSAGTQSKKCLLIK